MYSSNNIIKIAIKNYTKVESKTQIYMEIDPPILYRIVIKKELCAQYKIKRHIHISDDIDYKWSHVKINIKHQ